MCRQNDEPELWDGKFIDVDTGKVKVHLRPAILRAMAIGSCVVVAIYDRYKKIGGLAHIMLPGRSPKRDGKDKTKYAEDAIDTLLTTAKKLGAETSNLEVNLVGGANILGEGDIPDKVAKSVLDYLKKLSIEPKSEEIGGKERRSIFLNIDSGKIFYSQGDNAVMKLK